MAELAAAKLPELPPSEKSLDNLVRAQGWRNDEARARKVAGRTKPVFQYHVSLLPELAQRRLRAIHGRPANDDTNPAIERKKALWARFETLSAEHRAIGQMRLETLLFEEELIEQGLTAAAAVAMAISKARCSRSQFYEWRSMVSGVDREDWHAALAPNYAATATWSDCHPEAWEFFKSDFLRPEGPKLSPCYRRLLEAAKKKRWSPIPHEQALRRRLNAEVPKAVQVLARQKAETAKAQYPAQRRSRAHLHAMQMVNMDGHKLDVFVRVPWSDKPVRMYLVGVQDLYSGKILAWRLSDSENKETVRLVIGDVVEHHGLFDHIYLDNGRSFASKWITGGARNRFRFKIKDEDPVGILISIGLPSKNIHWTTPYSGQSKPIERAWGDLAENVSKHPFCSGAYVGNKPDAKPENYGTRAIPLADFHAHVAREIALHNARTGRTGGNCKGRSFDETFAASLADDATIVRHATRAQRALWLLASEVIRAQKGSGEIHFAGNRYWSRELNQHAGKKVVIRFDPDALHTRVLVYDLKDALICEAPCIADVGFDDLEAARVHAKRRRDYQKANKAQLEAHRTLTAAQLADILTEGEKAPARPEPVRTKVARLVTTPPKPAGRIITNGEAEDAFGRAMARIQDPAAILEFPPRDPKGGNGPASIASGSSSPKRKAYGSPTKTNV